jgi:hypothetical protein
MHRILGDVKGVQEIRFKGVNYVEKWKQLVDIVPADHCKEDVCHRRIDLWI